MGSCVSVHKKSEPEIGPEKKGSSQIQPASKESKTQDEVVGRQSHSVANRSTFEDVDGKGESFFDSQPWLDSDSEDFLSVNGDFTPSRGNTPVHQNSYLHTPPPDNCLSVSNKTISKPEPSPTDDKKKLADLFHESISENQQDDNQSLLGVKTIRSNGMPEGSNAVQNQTLHKRKENSVCTNEMSPVGVANLEKQKLSRSLSSCIPGLARSMSFSDRKKRLSPAQTFDR
ncbi:hypothetical protein NMG60_11024736 [Bertholletia excelsa]